MTTSGRDGMQLLESSLSGLVSTGVITLDDAQAISMYPDEVVYHQQVVGRT